MKWTKWDDRKSIVNIKEPGIYFIAYSKVDLSKRDFDVIREIIYIGMSISKKGVRGRLEQFKNAMFGKDGTHGGAERVRFKHKDSSLFFNNTYVAVSPFPLIQNNEVYNWKQKGECVKHEYVSFANYFEKFEELPEFNDQKRSKKK